MLLAAEIAKMIKRCKMSVSVGTTINASTKKLLEEKELARLLTSCTWDETYSTQLFVFFTECPVSAIYRFCREYFVPFEAVRKYYERYVKKYYTNSELEDFLNEWQRG